MNFWFRLVVFVFCDPEKITLRGPLVCYMPSLLARCSEIIGLDLFVVEL